MFLLVSSDDRVPVLGSHSHQHVVGADLFRLYLLHFCIVDVPVRVKDIPVAVVRVYAKISSHAAILH